MGIFTHCFVRPPENIEAILNLRGLPGMLSRQRTISFLNTKYNCQVFGLGGRVLHAEWKAASIPSSEVTYILSPFITFLLTVYFYRDSSTEFFAVADRLLNEGKIKPHPVKIMPNGLEDVQEGLQLQRNNDLSAEKIVYRIGKDN